MQKKSTETGNNQDLGYIVQGGRLWRRGYTTGSCAAAAAKAATMMLLANKCPDSIEINTPQGLKLKLPIHKVQLSNNSAICQVIKDAGDDPDITHGAVIEAKVRKITPTTLSQTNICIIGGNGVGRVTKPGLMLPVGSPAINPVPLQMITNEVNAVRPEDVQLEVEIRVIDGEEIAKKTLNLQLGIVGGISILGTTGIVEPMSEEAFKTSLTPQIQVAKALGWDRLVLTPGRMGQEHATNLYALPEAAVNITSNFIGYMLEECVRLDIKQVMLFGHIGKLVKIAGGIFHTHNRVANARLEIITANAGLLGASQQVLSQLMECSTVEGALDILDQEGLQTLYSLLATKAGERAEQYVHQQLKVGIVLTNLKGNILGLNEQARQIGGHLKWNYQSG